MSDHKKEDNKQRRKQVSFEQSLLELEQLVRQLEDGQLGLDQTLAAYEQGVRLLKECYGLLEGAERRIELLKRLDENGQPVVESFDVGQLSLDEKAARRGQRRSHGSVAASTDGKPAADVDVGDQLF